MDVSEFSNDVLLDLYYHQREFLTHDGDGCITQDEYDVLDEYRTEIFKRMNVWHRA